MIDIAQRIGVIKALLQEDTDASLTYAALECRITIEQVCYDRLKMSYGHISYDDLAKWQPRHVVMQVVEDANELAASGFVFSMSREPVPNDRLLSREEFEEQEYIQIGKQAALDLSKLGKLWNALSRVALHSQLPEKKSEDVRPYGCREAIERQVKSTLEELERLKSGTLLSSGLGMNYYFPCVSCGVEIRRILKLLKHGQVVSCVNPECKESYQIHKEGEAISHIQRTVSVKCEKCEGQVAIAQRLVDDLRQGDQLDMSCDACGHVSLIKVIPVLVKANKQVNQNSGQ
ncbi:MAG: hypothetical protein OQL11_11100 [Gammaproteobacteria bacterium]|nr:hypothetical protein [Gammaproteobacteria bacterium]